MIVIDSIYPGKCYTCQTNWVEGDQIAFDEEASDDRMPDGRWVHEECHSEF